MEMSRAIYFDMDGTIADLYGYNNWLQELRKGAATPYRKAAPLIKMQLLARRLNKLQRLGYKIGIISWLAKDSKEQYDKEVTKAKLYWLNKHLHSVKWDEIHIVKYGTPKESVCNMPFGVLFDDEERNRRNWKGVAYDETNILEILKAIA